MRLLIVSEGPHERGKDEQRSALQTLVTRIRGADLQRVEHEKLSKRSIHAIHGKGRGYYKKAVRWLLHAERSRRYDAVVLLVDQDGKPERLAEINDAQSYADIGMPRAFGVAVRTFDAWMLADEIALTRVVGETIQRQSDPESIRNPKRVCEEIRNSAPTNLGLSEMYAQVAETVDLEVLEERCPLGFAPFAERTRALNSTNESTAR